MVCAKVEALIPIKQRERLSFFNRMSIVFPEFYKKFLKRYKPVILKNNEIIK